MFNLLIVAWVMALAGLIFLSMDYQFNKEPFFKNVLTEFEHKIFIGFVGFVGFLVCSPILALWGHGLYTGDAKAYNMLYFILSCVGLGSLTAFAIKRSESKENGNTA